MQQFRQLFPVDQPERVVANAHRPSPGHLHIPLQVDQHSDVQLCQPQLKNRDRVDPQPALRPPMLRFL